MCCLLGFALAGARSEPAKSNWMPDFVNIAKQAGLTDVFPNGGVTTKEFIIETTGSGIAFVDYDNDGLLDLFVLSGKGGTNRMYRNEGHDRFRDVTEALGLKSDGWNEGVCAGDYDNDGFTDLFVTAWGENHLYRNLGGKGFADVTAEAGLRQSRVRYNTGCAFLDIDGDGRLDLFVANYLKFDQAMTPHKGANPYCFYLGIAVNCGPRGLPFDRNILYRNEGGGKFKDISDESGISKPEGHYGLSVLTGDFNEDGLPDIYVACDQTPSLLYINKGHGRFEEEAVLRGVAFDENGKAMSGMGLAAADTTGSSHSDIFRTNFSDEFETLYRNRGKGIFDDATLEAGLGLNTKYVGWGTGFLDFNNDGWEDLMLVNGHVFPEVDTLHSDIHYRDRAILYENLTNGKFRDVSKEAGPAFAELHSARGTAFGDMDNDGQVEIAVNNQNESPSLFKDEKRPPGHWLIVKLTGTRANRSAIGARVKLSAGGHSQSREVRSGGSYLSQGDLRLEFGLGDSEKVDQMEVTWPGGEKQVLRGVKADQVLAVRQQ